MASTRSSSKKALNAEIVPAPAQIIKATIPNAARPALQPKSANPLKRKLPIDSAEYVKTTKLPTQPELNLPAALPIQEPPQSWRPISQYVAPGPCAIREFIEVCPEDAWKVPGHWKIIAPDLADSFRLDKIASLSIEFQISNNSLHTKIGRQLWATFDFGGVIKGCMRFCPLNSLDITKCRLSDFLDACPLKTGLWPGPSEGSQWAYRWGGAKEGTRIDKSDMQNGSIEFIMGDDGQLRLKGTFPHGKEQIAFEASRIGDSIPLKAADQKTPKGVWDQYRKQIASNNPWATPKRGRWVIVSRGYYDSD